MKFRIIIIAATLILASILTYISLPRNTADKHPNPVPFHVQYAHWKILVNRALSNGREILIFVDGTPRELLGKQAHHHCEFLMQELKTEPLVVLILARNTILSSPDRRARFNLKLGEITPEQQIAWAACLEDYLKEEREK